MGRGKLVFKGDDPQKKKKKSKHSKESSRTAEVVAEATVSSTAQKPVSSTSSSAKSATTPQIVSGTGTITSSGSVVTGVGTKFERELAAGDAMIVVINGQQEMRVVTMRLSNVSLNLSSAFSQSLKHPTPFQVIRKPRDEAKQKRLAQQKALQSSKEEEVKASGASTEELVYREKTEHGSYRIKREKVDGVSRGDLLHMRAKKTSDKYC